MTRARILLAAVGASAVAMAFADFALANDCAEYVKKFGNIVGIPKGLMEDCMRTGYVQAITTAVTGMIGGTVIAAGVNKALGDAMKQWEDAQKGKAAEPPEIMFHDDHCRSCNVELPKIAPGGLCPECGTFNELTAVGRCPKCNAVINLDSGECVACKGMFFPPKLEPPPLPPPPADTEIIFDNDQCIGCGAVLPRMAPGGLCPACKTQNPLTAMGKCPKCGHYINVETGRCVACKHLFEPPRLEPPPLRTCPGCGREIDFVAMPDGRCPGCGTKVPANDTGASAPSSTPSRSQSGDPDAPPTAGDPNAPAAPEAAAAGSTTPGASASGATSSTTPGATPSSGTTPSVDPPFTQQGTVSGDKAAKLLEESGLAKVTRDGSGKVIKIEEAYPGAFTDFRGQTVTLQTSESSGGGTGPDWVETAKGKITGIGFKPTADGGIGEPVVVVNHGESQWNEVKPPTPDPFTAAIDAAKDAAQKAVDQGSEAIKQAREQYEKARSDVDLADKARAAYQGTKLVLGAEAVDQAAADLAKELNINVDEAMKILNSDDLTWEQTKAKVNLPGIFLGDKPI